MKTFRVDTETVLVVDMIQCVTVAEDDNGSWGVWVKYVGDTTPTRVRRFEQCWKTHLALDLLGQHGIVAVWGREEILAQVRQNGLDVELEERYEAMNPEVLANKFASKLLEAVEAV